MTREGNANPNEGATSNNNSGDQTDLGNGNGDDRKKVDDVLDGEDGGNNTNSPITPEEVRKVIEQAVSAKAAELESAYAPVKKENERLKEELSQLKEELAKMKASSVEGEGGSADNVKSILEEREKALKELEQRLLEERQRRIEIERSRALDEAFSKHLVNMDWASDSARNMALRQVGQEIVYDEKENTFKHKTGVPLEQWVSIYVSAENNKFLFRQRPNRGAGASPSGNSNKKKTIFDLEIDEVIEKYKRGEV